MRDYQRSLLLCFLFLVIPAFATASEKAAARATAQAIDKSITIIEKSLAEYPKHNTCFSCHHQGAPALALSLAKERGHHIEAGTLSGIARHTSADLRADLELYRKGQGQPGGVTRAGYALLALEAVGSQRDDLTALVTKYLLTRDREQGNWHARSHRPPSEFSDFTDTFLAIRALRKFGETADQNETAARIEKARQWLEQTAPKDTEDRVFQLWGMSEAGSESTVRNKAAKSLIAEQREDGGWTQVPGAGSDAYATGSVLTVLLTTGELKPRDAACNRAVKYLLREQQPDGSWHVVSRSKPFQPYFESGFPYGRDQFISILATGWATAALALSEPVAR
jgi:N-acyl-D-amino-acid deacylase